MVYVYRCSNCGNEKINKTCSRGWKCNNCSGWMSRDLAKEELENAKIISKHKEVSAS
jgi:ribosomal protein L37AE/L43A